MAKLTVKQENFCNYYIETGNASEAYRRAYSCDKMKDETVNVKASELLNNGKITVRVKQLQDALQKRSDITKDEVIKELSSIVRSRVTDVLSAKGMTVRIKSIEELPDEVVACISSIKKIKGGIEVKFYDKIAAIDRLSKMLGWDKATKIDMQGSVPVKEWLSKFGGDEE
ncbi:MAG: terminase small subunit [Petrimonas sp.]|uniref:terminase small subunit n=1 Tax=Petrimonas sp. TaxID=2023866 RepID=UPI002B3FFB6C|nr:terminase small subunit [Petrimonas sp.]MEA5046723.1 terminase small subunit [Petrimonas sp.]